MWIILFLFCSVIWLHGMERPISETKEWINLAYNIKTDTTNQITTLPYELQAKIATFLTYRFPEQTIDNLMHGSEIEHYKTFTLKGDLSSIRKPIFQILCIDDFNKTLLYATSLPNSTSYDHRWIMHRLNLVSGDDAAISYITTEYKDDLIRNTAIHDKTLIIARSILYPDQLPCFIDIETREWIRASVTLSFPVDTKQKHISIRYLVSHRTLPLSALQCGDRGDIVIHNLTTYQQLEHPITLQTRTGEIHTRVFNVQPKIWHTMQTTGLKENVLDLQDDWDATYVTRGLLAWHPYKPLLAQIFKGNLYVWDFASDKRLIYTDRTEDCCYRQAYFSALGTLLTRGIKSLKNGESQREIYEHPLDKRTKRLLLQEEAYLCGVGIKTLHLSSPDETNAREYLKCDSQKKEFELPISHDPQSSFSYKIRDTNVIDIYKIAEKFTATRIPSLEHYCILCAALNVKTDADKKLFTLRCHKQLMDETAACYPLFAMWRLQYT